jgi:NADPH-dependent glutamate synthase beta subunit-like oxidoreductase
MAIRTETYLSDRAGVFGGGDVVNGPSSVIKAIAAGKKAAIMIDRYVTGKLLEESEGDAAVRVVAPKRPWAERKRDFREDEVAICEEAAVCEARRCLRCDLGFTQKD